MQEILREIESLTNERNKALRHIESAREKATNISPVYSLVKSTAGNVSSKVESGAIDATSLQGAVVEIDRELESLRKTIAPYISLLDPGTSRTLAKQRLMEGLSCEEIAAREHYSISGVYKALRRVKRQMIFLSSKRVHVSTHECT